MKAITIDIEPTATSASQAQRSFGRSGDAREAANLETVRQYLATIEMNGEPSMFFAPDVQQVEFPNQLVKEGAVRDLTQLREAGERGRKVIRAQRYAVRRAYADGDTVILEVLWTGTLATPVGNLAAGEDMRAHFCVVIELRQGKIQRQRNYDCFEPFA